MGLFEDLKKIQFDKRMIRWNKTQGLITEQEFQQHLESLVDEKSKAEQIDLKHTPSSVSSAMAGDAVSSSNGQSGQKPPGFSQGPFGQQHNF